MQQHTFMRCFLSLGILQQPTAPHILWSRVAPSLDYKRDLSWCWQRAELKPHFHGKAGHHAAQILPGVFHAGKTLCLRREKIQGRDVGGVSAETHQSQVPCGTRQNPFPSTLAVDSLPLAVPTGDFFPSRTLEVPYIRGKSCTHTGPRCFPSQTWHPARASIMGEQPLHPTPHLSFPFLRANICSPTFHKQNTPDIWLSLGKSLPAGVDAGRQQAGKNPFAQPSSCPFASQPQQKTKQTTKHAPNFPGKKSDLPRTTTRGEGQALCGDPNVCPGWQLIPRGSAGSGGC